MTWNNTWYFVSEEVIHKYQAGFTAQSLGIMATGFPKDLVSTLVTKTVQMATGKYLE